MRNLLTYEQFLFEGGWSSDKTQGTVITPDVIAEIVKHIKDVSSKFNQHLETKALPPLDFSQPIGSGTWWEEDVKNQPDKTYGDVDFMVSYPILKLTDKGERADEIATVKLYNEVLLDWLDSVKPLTVDPKGSREISTPDSVKLLMTLSNERYVQVDMVVTHTEYKEWAIFRFTPERNVKGFVNGKLYTTLGNLLEITIQPRGVRAKFVGDIMVPFSKRAGATERLISLSSQTFITDIAKFFWEQKNSNEPFRPSESLQRWKGINPSNPTFKDICEGIRALAETLEGMREFGTVLKYKNADEFLQAFVKQYTDVMTGTANSTKFAKAKTPEAFAAIEKIRSLIDKYTKLAKEYLL
jgi:uncharacterized protein YaaR (DUF327 family)